MANIQSAWTIKGVEEEAKNIAKQSAKKCGTTIGSWLEELIFSNSPKQYVKQDYAKISSGRGQSKVIAQKSHSRLPQIMPENASTPSIRLQGPMFTGGFDLSVFEQKLDRAIADMESRLARLERQVQEALKATEEKNKLQNLIAAAPVLSAALNPVQKFSLQSSYAAQYAPADMPSMQGRKERHWMQLLVLTLLGLCAFLLGEKLGGGIF